MYFAIYNSTMKIIQKCQKQFGKRPHRHHHLVTPRGGEWIRPVLIPSNTWFLESSDQQESAEKRAHDHFIHFCTAHPCDHHTNRQAHKPRYVRRLAGDAAQ